MTSCERYLPLESLFNTPHQVNNFLISSRRNSIRVFFLGFSAVCNSQIGVGTPSSQRILAPLLRWKRDNPPPAKIVFISDSRSVYFASRLFSYLQELGFHILVVYGDTPKPPPGLVTCASWQWLSLLDGVYSSLSPGETRKQPLLQDKPASFVCRLCCDFTSFQYFECQSLEDLTTHFNSEEHKLRVSILSLSLFFAHCTFLSLFNCCYCLLCIPWISNLWPHVIGCQTVLSTLSYPWQRGDCPRWFQAIKGKSYYLSQVS